MEDFGRIVQEHISVTTIERYRKRLLSAAELLAVDDHAAVCADCRLQIGGKADSPTSSGDLIAGLEDEEFDHPDYEQFAAYVDGHLDSVERECFESHVACCAPCASELRELQVLQAETAARLSPGENPAPIVETTAAGLPSWREKATALWRAPWFRLPLQTAMATATLALVVWVATLPLRRELADLRLQLAQTEQRNEDLQREYEIARADAEDLQAQITLLQSENQNPPSSPIFAFSDAAVKIDAQGNIAGLETLLPPYRQAVSAALGTGQVKTPLAISSLTGKAGVLMGGAANGVAFPLLRPIGTAVSSVQPTFRWQALAGASSYRVTVTDADFNVIAQSPLVSSASSFLTWTIGEALERGRVYVWTVTAIKDGKELISPVPPAPEARFKVLEKDRVDEVVAARKAHPDSHLVAGLAYAQAGLLDEAEREFQLLARANPASEVARKLLRSVKSLRGR